MMWNVYLCGAGAEQQSATGQQSAQGQPAQQSNPAADQQSTIGVKQINKIIPTLRKRDLLSVKKNIDNTLAGRSPSTASAPTAAAPAAPAPAAGNSAFGQMAGQLSGSNKSKSSTGGTTTKTPTGLVHTATKPNVPVQKPATPPATDNVVKMPKGKVRAAKEGGVTPEEQAKFDQRVQQAMASQKE